MTKLEYLGAVIDWYSENTRSVDIFGDCQYEHRGHYCAIGLMMKHGDAIDPEFESTSVKDLPEDIIQSLDIQDLDFLVKVQNLHDDDVNWCVKGLTDCGLDTVDKIIKEFKL